MSCLNACSIYLKKTVATGFGSKSSAALDNAFLMLRRLGRDYLAERSIFLWRHVRYAPSGRGKSTIVDRLHRTTRSTRRENKRPQTILPIKVRGR